jgi:hypothetical protein
MIGWGDFEVTLEQHQDRLRRAEKKRLIEQATAFRQRPTLWASIKRLVQGTIKPETIQHGMETGQPTDFVNDSI